MTTETETTQALLQALTDELLPALVHSPNAALSASYTLLVNLLASSDDMSRPVIAASMAATLEGDVRQMRAAGIQLVEVAGHA